jgi:sec-independent protein translocase protein TatC
MVKDDRESGGSDNGDLTSRMSFLQHLEELRKRLLWALASVGVGFVIAIFFAQEIFGFIMRPMQRLLPDGQHLIYTDPGEAFMLQVKIALIAGLIIASPLVFSQLWLFIAPGLYAREKRWALPFIAVSSVFFAAGAAFAHYVVFPIVWRFLGDFTTDYLTFMPRVEPAFSMYLRLILALGIAFQLPTLVVFLARMGMITPRFMIRNFKFAVLLIVIVAGVLSPDGGGVGMAVMGGPVILLYILSIGLAWAFGRKKAIATDSHPSEQALLLLLSADWIRRKYLEVLSSKAVAQALRS